MGSARQHQQQQRAHLHHQLYGDRAYWQFVVHANNDIVLILVFGLLIIYLLAALAQLICTATRGKVRQTSPAADLD